MPIKGDRALISSLESFAREVEVDKPVQTISAILQVGQAISIQYAPIEYSTLINSVRNVVVQRGGRIMGILGYYTSYAYYLNFNPNWSPRPPEQKAGPAWNPNATSHFLEKGFTSPEARTQIMRVITEVNKK